MAMVAFPLMTRVRDDHDFPLVRRARDGDHDAFSELVRRHQDRVYSLVRGIVRNRDDAADVTQETFIAVLRHLDTFIEGARFSTWLHRIAVRKAYDLMRKRVPDPVDPDAPQLALQAAIGNPHETYLAQQTLLDSVAALDDGFREAVLLVDVLGCSVEDAAGVLQVAPGTIKSRVFRGRATMAQLLAAQGYGGGATTGTQQQQGASNL